MIDVPDHIQDAVAQKFRDSYPEYYGSEINAALMHGAVQQLVDAGHNFSADTLALAFNHIDAGGHFEQPEVDVVEITSEEKHAHNLAEHVDNMTDEHLDRSLLSLGV